MTTRMKGSVKFFNTEKGFGFIIPNDPQHTDVFVHISAVEAAGMKTLKEGDTLEFELAQDRGKTKAANLQKVA